MKHLIVAFLVATLGLALAPSDAEAARFGGGKSLGRKGYNQQAQPPAQAPRQPAQAQGGQGAQGAAARSGASRWLGPLAGLAAGGLLAALLFGDAFEGFQFLDFLLLAAAAFAIFAFLRARRRQQATGASHGQTYAAAGPAGGGGAAFQTPEIGSGGETVAPRPQERPAWFEEEAFLRDAKKHFVRLQAAWDKADMQDIREYTTAELFAELTLERQGLDQADQFTEVVSLEAQFLGLSRAEEHVVASVRFSGLIREARDAEPHAFSEIWHIQRAAAGEGNWYIAGIEQEELPQGPA